MAFLSAALAGISVANKVRKKITKARRGVRKSAFAPVITGSASGGPVFEAPPDDYVTVEAGEGGMRDNTVEVAIDEAGNSYQLTDTRGRRRRRRLLTTQDKADIAFIIGTMGKGQMASSAIAQLLARRV